MPGNDAVYLLLPQPLRIRDMMFTLEKTTWAFIGTMLPFIDCMCSFSKQRVCEVPPLHDGV